MLGISSRAKYERTIMYAIKYALPGVLTIAAKKEISKVKEEMQKMGLNPNEFAERLKEEASEGKVSISSGSAFVVDTSGIVLTNKHVIQDKDAEYSAVIDAAHYAIEVVAKDPLADIAIIKIKEPPKCLPMLRLGTSRNIQLGETVITIGNALGEFQNTVSVGIVSGLSRYLSATTDFDGHHERLRGLIQTDAAINPGNSGGPLINLSGEVIGINTAVVYGAQNIGFAIPVDRARRDLKEIKEVGHIKTPFLGIRYVLLNKKLREHLKTPVDSGAFIMREGITEEHAILPKSAAALAGLQERDIIIEADNIKITQEKTLEDIIDTHAVGDTLELRVLRKNIPLSFRILLEDREKFN